MLSIENTFSDELFELYKSYGFIEEQELRSCYIKEREPCSHPYIEDIREEAKASSEKKEVIEDEY